MAAGFEPPSRLPGGSPGRKLYAWLFVAVSCVVLVATGVGQGRTLPRDLQDLCRQFRLCSPPPLGELPDMQSGFGPGHGAEAAAQPYLETYRAANPDYDIRFVADNGREKNSCDDSVFKVDCRYSYGGTFTATPKWQGKLAWLGL
ncbi:hypothetical protein [Aurantimonas sp. Leaf443]|uniref:hypothetical protein n=1 Tax=Aurantimonas sp. Leaf443 TaxID=1736378 RepID=UPI0006FBD922|nr:hypothetical protein [Aurantimonas sp. Leaf443]KQT88262.1 hypothetical protein ASG48_02185 [Aurantimonas sp. Leaf443]